ncbi:unnamed protein product, partial [Discosporangium mesarthrocarpum]
MKVIFPEVVEAEARVVEVLLDEETTFNRTLDKGIKEFNKIADGLVDSNSPLFCFPARVVSGEAAFFLYSTMGFPLDLTALMAEEKVWYFSLP